MDNLRDKLTEYFSLLEQEATPEERQGRVIWRMICFDRGLKFADYIANNLFDVNGKDVIDVACAWGGDTLAFASKGAKAIGSDLNDHQFKKLGKFALDNGLAASFVQADCEELPFADQSADIILALDLIEHISHHDKFAREVARLLKPGGVCVITTPPRLKSFLLGEPHWGMRGLTAFPFSWQPFIARKLCKKDYPYPITRQYCKAGDIIKHFTPYNLKGDVALEGASLRLANKLKLTRSILEKYYWKLILIIKS